MMIKKSVCTAAPLSVEDVAKRRLATAVLRYKSLCSLGKALKCRGAQSEAVFQILTRYAAVIMMHRMTVECSHRSSATCSSGMRFHIRVAPGMGARREPGAEPGPCQGNFLVKVNAWRLSKQVPRRLSLRNVIAHVRQAEQVGLRSGLSTGKASRGAGTCRRICGGVMKQRTGRYNSLVEHGLPSFSGRNGQSSAGTRGQQAVRGAICATRSHSCKTISCVTVLDLLPQSSVRSTNIKKYTGDVA
jgi:hypothetical protein